MSLLNQYLEKVYSEAAESGYETELEEIKDLLTKFKRHLNDTFNKAEKDAEYDYITDIAIKMGIDPSDVPKGNGSDRTKLIVSIGSIKNKLKELSTEKQKVAFLAKVKKVLSKF